MADVEGYCSRIKHDGYYIFRINSIDKEYDSFPLLEIQISFGVQLR